MDSEGVNWSQKSAIHAANAVARVTALLARDLAMPAVADAILQQMVEVFGVRIAMLSAASEARRELTAIGQNSADGATEALVPARISFDDPYLSCLAVRTRHTQVIQDPCELPPLLTEARACAERYQLGAMLAVPLVAYDHLVGSLFCGFASGRVIRDDELAALNAIAQVCAVSLFNAQRFEEERRLRHQIDSVCRISLVIDRAKDLPGVVQATIDGACDIAGAHAGLMQLLPAEAGGSSSWYFFGLEGPRALLIQEALVATQFDRPELRDNHSWRANDTCDDAAFVTFPWRDLELCDTNVLCVPLHQESRTIARLYLLKNQRAEFIPEDEHVVETLAAHAVLAIGQVRAREELVRELERRRQAEQLLEFTQEAAHLGSWDWDISGDRIQYSEGALRMMGFAVPQGAISFEDVLQRIHPDDREGLTRVVEQSLRTPGQSPPLEYRIVWPDGTIRVLHAEGWTTFRKGAPVRSIGALIDVTDRKRVEDEHREREQWLSLIFDLAPIAMAIEDTDANFIRVNNALCELLGYSRDELLRMSFKDITSPENVPFGKAAMTDLLTGRIPRFTMAKQYRRKDGSIVDANLYLSLVRGAAGEPRNFIAQIEDVSERKRAERALRRSEEQLRAVIDHAPEGIFINQGGKIVLANVALASMLGYAKAEDILGLPATRLIHEDDRERGLARAQRTLSTGNPVPPEELRLLHRSGDGVPTETVGIRTEFEGKPAVLVLARDIAQRKRAEADRDRLISMLAAERLWLETVIDRTPVGIVLLEPGENGRIHMNRVAHELLGGASRLESELVHFVNPVVSISGRVLERDEKISTRVLSGEAIQGEEFLIKQANGVDCPVRVNASALRDEDGRISGGIVVVEDITSIKEQARMREEWMSVIAHDLRQPVTVIIAYAHLLAHELGDKAQQGKLDHIVRSARQLQRLIADLLDMSRIEARQLSLRREPVRVAEALRIASERAVAATNDHPIHVDVDAGVEAIWADPERLEQILGNLLTNAAKYSYPYSAIHLQAVAHGGEIEIRVTNTGEGLSPDEVRRLFSRFHRTSRAHESKVAGVGLGLYITRGLVEAHGGRIWAESEPNTVTTFAFTIPVAQSASRLLEAPRA